MSDVIVDNEIAVQLRTFIVDNFLLGNDESMVGPEESFMENGIIDSLGILELIEYCEETYSVSIDDEEILPENLDSLARLTSFICRKK